MKFEKSCMRIEDIAGIAQNRANPAALVLFLTIFSYSLLPLFFFYLILSARHLCEAYNGTKLNHDK